MHNERGQCQRHEMHRLDAGPRGHSGAVGRRIVVGQRCLDAVKYLVGHCRRGSYDNTTVTPTEWRVERWRLSPYQLATPHR